MAAKMKKLYISIPNPCGEDWERMEKRKDGRFCMNCEKTVVDFTQMSDKELYNYFSLQRPIPCGRFDTVQLNRVIEPPKTNACFPSCFKAMAATIATVISLETYAAKPAMNFPAIQLVQPSNRGMKEVLVVKDTIVSGIVKDANGKPIGNAKISSSAIGDVYTGSDGRFSINLTSDNAIPQTLVFSFDSLVPVARSYHPAMANAVYDIVLYPKPHFEGCGIMGDLGGAPLVSFIDDYPSISFANGKTDLSADTKAILARVAMKLKENPMANVVIKAYPGKHDAKQKISDKRLFSVVNYLVEKLGISSERIMTDKVPGGGDANTIDFSSQ